MRRALLLLWLIGSAVLLLLTLGLAWVSLMMGAVHWDWWLSLGLGVGFLALALGAAWMCRKAYRSMKTGK